MKKSLSVSEDKKPPYKMAEREGFEPSIRVNVYTLSRRAPSTARTSLRDRSETLCRSWKGSAGTAF